MNDLYDFLSRYELPRRPGAKFDYSNVGMSLLGHVMERKTGADYESLVVDRRSGGKENEVRQVDEAEVPDCRRLVLWNQR